MAELAVGGWAATTVPEAWGGTGAANNELAVIHIALARHSLVVAQAFYSLWLLGADLLARLGSPAQREAWLPRIAAGTARIAFALTEPDSGSDAAAVRTAGRPVDGGFMVSGQKVFITGAAVADAVVVTARTDPGPRRQDGLSLLLLDPGAAGVSIRPIKKIALHALDLCEVFFDEVWVPAESLIGEQGRGWDHLRGGLAKERTSLAAICTGALHDLIDRCAAHACERQAFGQPIGRFQMVAEKIVDMKVAASAARALTMQAAHGLDHDAVIDASIAKLFASEAYVGATRKPSRSSAGTGSPRTTPSGATTGTPSISRSGAGRRKSSA